MSRYTKTQVTQLSANEQAAIDNINKNFDDIQSAIQDTVSRGGNTPTHMTHDLDMNGKRIINVPAPLSDTDLVRRQDVVGDIALVQSLVNTTTNAAAQALEAAQDVQQIIQDANVALVGDDLALEENSKIRITANNIANVNYVGSNISNVNSVADNIDNIVAVKNNATNINAVNANKTNIDTVAANNADITTVATNISDVNTVSDNISDVTTVSGISSDVTTTAGLAEDIPVVVSLKDDIPVVVQAAHDIDIVEDIASDIIAVADITSDVTSVASNATDVTTVATNISDVNTVATDISDVGTVASNISNINTVAGIDSDISTVASNSSNITAVAANESNINAVNNNSSNINAVAGNNTNITAVANNATNINAVNANKTNIDTVAGATSNISTVATNISDINDVQDNLTDISSVASNNANITAVANNETNINAVAGNSTNINAVNANKTNIDAVAGNGSNITAVANNATNINAVNSNKTNINTVATNISDVNDVADIASSVSTVAGMSSNIASVVGNATNINSVAGDLTNINAVAADLTNIDAASSYAAESKQWAIGDPTEPSGGSAKYWAEQAAQGQIQSDWDQSDSTKKDYIKNKPTIDDLLPTQTSQSGKFLTTNGSVSSWATVDALPSQTGQSGKFLTTNGNTASWAGVTIPTVNDATLTIQQNGTTVDTFTANSSTNKTINIKTEQFKLFHHDWFDYQLNDQSWLRADTFSWQDGTVYSDAYDHLVDDYTNGTSTTETVGSYTITYVLAADGHKITTDETNVLNIYNESGVAWYYILDTTNQRFKLPIENPAREELIQVIRAKGNGMTLGTTNGTTNYGLTTLSSGQYGGETATYGQPVGTARGGSSSGQISAGITTDSTKSGIISSMTDSTSVYKGKKYLYFYVGQFTQTATEQTAGLNSELFNGKVDIDLNNSLVTNSFAIKLNNAGIRTVVESYTNGKSWYRIWSDGWIEQGGYATSGTVTLLKTYTNANYAIKVTPVGTNNSAYFDKGFVVTDSQTTTQFKVLGQVVNAWYWQTEGY